MTKRNLKIQMNSRSKQHLRSQNIRAANLEKQKGAAANRLTYQTSPTNRYLKQKYFNKVFHYNQLII